MILHAPAEAGGAEEAAGVDNPAIPGPEVAAAGQGVMEDQVAVENPVKADQAAEGTVADPERTGTVAADMVADPEKTTPEAARPEVAEDTEAADTRVAAGPEPLLVNEVFAPDLAIGGQVFLPALSDPGFIPACFDLLT